jgi:hypothetical protein
MYVTMYVTESRKHTDGRCCVVAKVTGTYDKTGLPDPLTLRFYFSAAAYTGRLAAACAQPGDVCLHDDPATIRSGGAHRDA